MSVRSRDLDSVESSARVDIDSVESTVEVDSVEDLSSYILRSSSVAVRVNVDLVVLASDGVPSDSE